MKTHREVLDRMRSRASALRIAFGTLLVVGVVGSVLLGIQAGRSINFDTGFILNFSTTNNTARGVTVFSYGLVITVIQTHAAGVHSVDDVGSVGAIKKPFRSIAFGTEQP